MTVSLFTTGLWSQRTEATNCVCSSPYYSRTRKMRNSVNILWNKWMVLQFSLLGRKKPASRLRESCLSILGLYFESSLTWVSILRMWDVSWVLFSRKLGRNFRHRLRVAFACRGKVEGQAKKGGLMEESLGGPSEYSLGTRLLVSWPDSGTMLRTCRGPGEQLRDITASVAAAGTRQGWFGLQLCDTEVKSRDLA